MPSTTEPSLQLSKSSFLNVLPHSFQFLSSLSTATQLAPTLLSDTFFIIFICTSFKNTFHLLFLLPLLPMFFSFFLSASFPSTSGVYKNTSEASNNLMNGLSALLRFSYFYYGIYVLGIFISEIEVRSLRDWNQDINYWVAGQSD